MHYQDTPLNNKIIEKCPLLSSKTYRPAPLFPIGKMHIFLGSNFDKKVKTDIYDREIIDLPKEG